MSHCVGGETKVVREDTASAKEQSWAKTGLRSADETPIEGAPPTNMGEGDLAREMRLG